jgi:ribosomal protein S18 acetylase RimI-like enzyme
VMTAQALQTDGWMLMASAPADVDAMMLWFGGRADVEIWGGPSFRFPFTRRSFRKDIYWGRMASYSLFDPRGRFTGFGQLYVRSGRINLARLVVDPELRGHGVGKRLVALLMEAGAAQFPCNEFSLFVFRDNLRAFRCYEAMGFVIDDYPDDMPHADVCYYLTRPVDEPGVKSCTAAALQG